MSQYKVSIHYTGSQRDDIKKQILIWIRTYGGLNIVPINVNNLNGGH